MRVPLGILAVAGAGGDVGIAAYDLIETAFGTGASATITFSSIPQTYKHLQIRFAARATNNVLNLRMNGISSTVYARHSLAGATTTVNSTNEISQTYISMPQAVYSGTAASQTSAGIIDILDYSSSSKNKTIRALYGQVTSTEQIYLTSGLYGETTAITSLSFVNSGSFTTVTRFSLYGIKG